MYLFTCYLIKQFPIGHRVLWARNEEELLKKLMNGEEELFFIHFSKDHFDGKMKKINQFLGLENAALFFSELVTIGFTEGKKNYRKFLTQKEFDLEFQFQSKSRRFDELFYSLHRIFPNKEIWQICRETMVFAMQALFELPQEDILGSTLN